MIVVYSGLEHSVLDHPCVLIVAVVLYLSVCVHVLVSLIMVKEERLKLALAALQKEKEKKSINGAAKRFQVPYTTLRDHVSKRYTKIGQGHPTVLIEAEERKIVYCCQVHVQLYVKLN